MYISERRFLGMALGLLVLLGPLNVQGQAQYDPTSLGLNPYVNPLLGGSFYGFGGGGYGGLGYGSLLNGGYSGSGYGSSDHDSQHDSSSGGSGLYGGSGGGLLSSAISGAAYGYGYGLSNVQWMMNPYQGYLQGAANVTRANADYYKTLPQAKLTRQETIRSSLETRRAMIEEVEWERAHMSDPEKIRQRTLERELTTARVSPPPSDVWSGRALNALLRHLITQLGDGAKGPRIPLNEDIAKHINVKVGDSIGSVALLKNKGELDWPQSLQGNAFKESREQLNNLMHRAYRSVESGNNPDSATLNDLQDQYRKMRDNLRNIVSEVNPDDYIEAQRYLNEVGHTVKGLQDPDVCRQFSDWKPTKARSVAELVKHMREEGLLFAPATGGDEAAYMALYYALAAFDSGLGRVIVGAPGKADAGEIK